MSYSSQVLRARFTDGALSTASGPRVVVMAYDRLDRDLAGAIAAIEVKDVPAAHDLLVHAQDIVHELQCMLDLDAWEHAATLSAIYGYVGELLTRSNVTKAAAPAIEARRLLAELGDAFRQAATQVNQATVWSEGATERHVSVRA